MDHKLMQISAISSGIAFVSLAINLLLIAASKRQRRAMNVLGSQVEEEVSALSRDLDTASKQAGEHARRIAWLESRARSTRVEPKTITESIATVPQRITITEKRHRVLSLARRGQDIQTIAQTLGMNHGEVELMINLGRAA